MLDHRQHAAGQQALGDGGGDCRDLVRLGTVGAVADHRVGAVAEHIGKRKTVNIQAEDVEIGC